jgi:acetyl-CoA C-acetyltransferase
LLAGVVKEVVARSGFAPEQIDDVSVGCASQAGEDSRNVARHAILLSGLPVATPGAVHNRLCGSGLNAIVAAAHTITCREAQVCLAGGVESMTRAPFVVGKADQAYAARDRHRHHGGAEQTFKPKKPRQLYQQYKREL